MTSDEFANRLLQEEKLALVPGNAFMVDEEAPCGSFRMNFSTPTPENIVKGVSVMAGVLAAQGL